ncbi:hypothetical protein QEZ52_22395 (plasmid) [Aliisedimentitalea scapharcae]|uniref:Protease inhibitor Inh n=1 Tax=Aliisedimentitalea scapharcae TaxID=1524259 RepID=A0ABZ2XZL0_9RHOB
MFHKLLLAALCLVEFTSTASAQEYATSGDWVINVNPDNGNGCYMQKIFETGTLIQVGFDPARKGAFFAAYNAAWTDIAVGETSAPLFDFNDSRFQGEALGVELNGVPGGYAFFDNPEFASEFGRRLSFTLQGAKGGSEEFDLAGSQRAISVVKECQTAQEE